MGHASHSSHPSAGDASQCFKSGMLIKHMASHWVKLHLEGWKGMPDSPEDKSLGVG
jgi:hypothetical protein